MRAALAAIFFLLAVDPARACHKFSVWLFPWPQRCPALALAPPSVRHRSSERVNVEIILPPQIPLPSLRDIDWGKAPDDDARGRLLLRTLIGKDDR